MFFRIVVFSEYVLAVRHERQKDRTLKEELPRSVGARYATGDHWKNNSRKKEGMEPKQQQHPLVDLTGDRSKVRCCKEQYCIGTWNVRSMNQGKLKVVKRDGKSQRWHSRNQQTKMDWNGWILTQMIVGKNPLEEMGVAIIVSKRVWNAVLGCNLKNDRLISVHFQSKPFNITVIQVCTPTSNAEEAEVKRFFEDLQDVLELTPQKDVLFIIGDWNAKVRSQETPGRFGLGVQNEAEQRLIRVLPRECTGHSKHPLPTTQEKTLHMDITRWSTPKSDYSLQPKMEKLYTVSKNMTGSWLWLRSWTPYCQIQTVIEGSRENHRTIQVWPKSNPL